MPPVQGDGRNVENHRSVLEYVSHRDDGRYQAIGIVLPHRALFRSRWGGSVRSVIGQV